ncbi:MAG: dinitrogenase iron-molybdenum cofactor biosynthesis protein [Candidatus Lokiarchaeota archaeon]|nr:dinitrogenase iron-molybdenum cofactor biosynthesis protein [Candidatus Lokiarchaeota archaeon]
MKRIAFPVENNAGLESEMSMHFGHAQYFCLVDVDEASNNVMKHEVINNLPHSEGGCMMPVNMLKNKNADFIVVGGIGGRPLMGFQQVGITVLHNTMPGAHVGELVANLSRLPVLAQSSCQH